MDWRYIKYENGDEELYNDASDPLEYKNLASLPEHAAKKKELAAMLPKKDAENLPFNAEGKKGQGKKKKKAEE